MPRFVLLYHDCPPNYERPSHWDFMLEHGDVMRTWALSRLPRDWRAAHSRTRTTFPNCPAVADINQVAAQQLSDHRRDFLEFEGELTNNRGQVIRTAEGSYEMISESLSTWMISLQGSEETQRVRLTRSGSESPCWLLNLLD